MSRPDNLGKAGVSVVSTEPDPPTPRALFCVGVWNEDYVDRFLRYSLPTRVSEGNLGVFDSSSLFLIYTRAGDVERIESSPAFRAAQRRIGIECVQCDRLIDGHRGSKYATLSKIQSAALARSRDFDLVFFDYADAAWADGSYRAAVKRLNQGYDAVFSVGYPVVDTAFRTLIDQCGVPSEPGCVSISPRKFSEHIYECLHPMARANIWASRSLSQSPSYVMWDVPGQGLLTRAFHLHLVAVRVYRDAPVFFEPFRSTLDEEFVARLARTHRKFHVVADSRELAVCSLAPADDNPYVMVPERVPNAGDVAVFAERSAGLVHRELFGHSIRLVVDDPVEERWRAAETEAAALATDIQRRLSIPDSLLAREAPAAFAARALRNAVQESWRSRKRERSVQARATLVGMLHTLGIVDAVRIHILPRLSPRLQQSLRVKVSRWIREGASLPRYSPHPQPWLSWLWWLRPRYWLYRRVRHH